MDALLNVILTPSFFYSILRVTTPIVFAAMGMVVANTAGIPNIALEGIMLIAAFVGMMTSALSSSAWIGLLCAILSGLLCAGILAFFTLYYRTNVILGGIAINSLASGGTVFALYLFCHDKGTSASVPSGVLPQVKIPLLDQIPVVGEILSGHNILTYLAFLSVIAVYILLKRTPLGFHLRAVGEDAHAAESVGIHVMRVQAVALLISWAAPSCPWAMSPGSPGTWWPAVDGLPSPPRPWAAPTPSVPPLPRSSSARPMPSPTPPACWAGRPIWYAPSPTVSPWWA